MENKQPSVLKRSSDFQNIYKKGKRKSLNPWLLMFYIENNKGNIRFGWTISRKVGSAVTRNRLKRWCREYFRSNTKNRKNPEVDINVVFKPMEKDFYRKLQYAEFTNSMDKAFETTFKSTKN